MMKPALVTPRKLTDHLQPASNITFAQVPLTRVSFGELPAQLAPFSRVRPRKRPGRTMARATR